MTDVLYLCIDSGGVTGYFSYCVLQRIFSTIGSFSFGSREKVGGLVGVSAGAIIAGLCAFDMFDTMTDTRCRSLITDVCSTKWPTSLKSTVKFDVLYSLFGDRLMGEAKFPLFIVTTSINGIATVFNSVDAKFASLRVVDVIHASSAIPLLMKPVLLENTLFIDGAVTTGSPTTLAYLLAKSRDIVEKNIHILTLGIDTPPPTFDETRCKNRIVQNVSKFSFRNMSRFFGSSDILFNTFTKHLLKDQCLRISTPLLCSSLDSSKLELLYTTAHTMFQASFYNIYMFLQPFLLKRIVHIMEK
jgi:predicted acylesterase/phospholipase RssA